MSSAAARSRARPARRRASRAAVRRRRAAIVLALVTGLAIAAVAIGLGSLDDAVREITLPLHHEDIIRQQAADKHLDPALVAAMIYEESRFRDQTSHAGARGLMQITPDTADFIAKQSGGYRFVQDDLATPQINIAYGTYFLRWLLDRYDGNEVEAIAAYNAGHGTVDTWIAKNGGSLETDQIPFPETRAYVDNVLERRGQYRERYGSELGL
jgi:soluble lytic murein transglycosylase